MELSAAAFFTAVLVLVVFIKYHLSRLKFYQLAAKLPGPPALPIVGNGLKFLVKQEVILQQFIELVNQYPSPMRLWIGARLIVIVRDPKHTQIILQSSKITKKAYIYDFLKPFMGNGLLTVSGPQHKAHRKLMQPLFSLRSIEGYSHLFQKHATRLAEVLRKHVDGPEFDIAHYLQDSAFEAAMDLLMEDKNDHSIDYKDIPQFVRRFYGIFYTRVRSIWLHFEPIYRKSWYYKEQMNMKKIATTLINEISKSRVPEIIERLKSEQKPEEVRTPSMLEMIFEMMMNDPKCLTEQDVIDHMMTFMATSQDTQGSAIGFTLMMLGVYPKIQEMVYQELKEVLGGKTTLDMTDVSQLKYLDMCIKEAMRLYPVAPYIFRDTTEDFQLENLTIPKDVTVTLSLFHLHRDPNNWERPNEFYPEHFAPEAVSKRHPYSFLPFSAGPRKCIAQQFSYVNMKIVISTLLLNYQIIANRKVEDIKLNNDISIRPVGGYLIKLRGRTQDGKAISVAA